MDDIVAVSEEPAPEQTLVTVLRIVRRGGGRAIPLHASRLGRVLL